MPIFHKCITFFKKATLLFFQRKEHYSTCITFGANCCSHFTISFGNHHAPKSLDILCKLCLAFWGLAYNNELQVFKRSPCTHPVHIQSVLYFDYLCFQQTIPIFILFQFYCMVYKSAYKSLFRLFLLHKTLFDHLYSSLILQKHKLKRQIMLWSHTRMSSCMI